MNQISQMVQSLAQSQTLAMSQKSTEMRARGVDVINLSVGEPDFNTPDHIKLAAIKAVSDNYSFYTPVPGYMSLRQAIANKLKEENGLDFQPTQIIVGNGAKQALANVVLSVLNPGDEAIIPTPAWVSYTEMVKMARATPVTVLAGIDTDFKITPQQLAAAITPHTRAIIICSPSNPTGSVYTRAELQGLVDVLAQHPDILVIADEIYEHINFTGGFTSLGTFPEIASRTVIINGVSKAYAMTGWRIGYCACPTWLAPAVSKLQGQYTSGASSIAQKAAEAAYTGSQECVEEMRRAFERRRDLVVQLAREIPGFTVNVPQGAFYLFPKVDTLFGKTTPEGQVVADAPVLCNYLLDSAHVATVPGDAFGAPGYIRLSYATADSTLRLALQRIKQAVENLK